MNFLAFFYRQFDLNLSLIRRLTLRVGKWAVFHPLKEIRNGML